jgi:hypothetical protein
MADRRKFEDIAADIHEALAEIGKEHLAEELTEGYSSTVLQRQAGQVPELEKQVISLQAKITKLERGPLRDKAFVEYGVDMEGLRPAEKRAIETYDGELDREQVAAFVEEFDLPLLNGQPPEGEQQQQPPAQRIAMQATTPPARRGPAQTRVSPDDVRKWNEVSPEKWLRFKQAHPEAAELILQGQTVEGLAFE